MEIISVAFMKGYDGVRFKEQDIDRVIGRLIKRWKDVDGADGATVNVEYGEIDVARKRYRREEMNT